MSARLSNKTRKLIFAELQAHEGYSLKAIAHRHKVSRQTLSRLRAELLLKGLSYKMPLEANRVNVITNIRGKAVDAPGSAVETSNMTDAQVREKLAELDRRATAYEQLSVEIGADTVAVLDAIARKENTTRHAIAAFAMLKWVTARYPDMLTDSNSPRH